MSVRIQSVLLYEPPPLSLVSLFSDLWTRPVSWSQAVVPVDNAVPIPRFAISPRLGPYVAIFCSDFSWLVPRAGHPGLLVGATRYLKCSAIAMAACDHEGGGCAHDPEDPPREEYWLYDAGEIVLGARTFDGADPSEARQEASLARAEFARQTSAGRGPVVDLLEHDLRPLPKFGRESRPWYRIPFGAGLPCLMGTFDSFLSGALEVPRREEWTVTGP